MIFRGRKLNYNIGMRMQGRAKKMLHYPFTDAGPGMGDDGLFSSTIEIHEATHNLP